MICLIKFHPLRLDVPASFTKSYIIFRPFQIALQIILSEMHILLEKHDQLSCQRSREYVFVRTEFFPFPFENLAHSPNLRFL